MNRAKILYPSNIPATLLTLAIAAASFYLVYTNKELLPPEIPLWYSKSWGIERISAQGWVWLPPSLILVIFFINQIIAKLLHSKGLVTIITWSSLAFGVLISFSLFRIISIVT